LGDTIELRERELNALDASNRALKEQIYTIEDMQQALSDAASETDKAFAQLERSLQTELTATLSALQTQFDALTESLNNQVTAARLASQIASENLGRICKAFLVR